MLLIIVFVEYLLRLLIENSAASFKGILARSGGVSTWMSDHLQTEDVVLIFILGQILF